VIDWADRVSEHLGVRIMDLRKPFNLTEQQKAERRFHIIMGCSFGAFLAALAGVLFYAVEINQEAHARFMAQCMQDHKEYECTVMWRAGDSQPPTVILIPSGK
jgi:hypothetical protein